MSHTQLIPNSPSLIAMKAHAPISIAASMLFGSFLLAQPADPTPTAPAEGQRAMAMAERATKVMGMDVRNQNNDKVGDVKDLAINLADGKVIALILSSGGFLGMGDQLSIIPPQAFQPQDKLLKINLTQEQLNASPRFPSSQWPDLNQDYLKKLYQAYQVDESWASGSPQSQVLKASDVLKMDVQNPGGHKLGTVNDLVLADGLSRISYAVISFGGFLGIGDDLSVIPCQQLKPDKDGKFLTLDATKETLEKAPRFKPDSWPQHLTAPDFLTRISQPFEATPAGQPNEATARREDMPAEDEADMDHSATMPERDSNGTAGNPDRSGEAKDADRSGEANKTMPGEQPDDAKDLQLTRDIRRAVIAEDNLSFSAKNVKIFTSGGQVILVGSVNSDDEARKLVEIATQHAGQGHVTNQLEVKKDSP